MTATAESAPAVRSVVYPVKATVDGREITGAKLVVTLAAAYLYVSDHTGVVEAWSADLTGEPALARPWEGRGYTSTLPTAGGDVVVTNLGGCGCGNQVLKHYRPFPSGPARIT